MLASLDKEDHNLRIFLEDGENVFEDSGLEGKIVDTNSLRSSLGSIYLDYEPEFQNRKPCIRREPSENLSQDFNVVFGNFIGEKVDSGDIFTEKVDEYQNVPKDYVVSIIPANDRGNYAQLYEEILSTEKI